MRRRLKQAAIVLVLAFVSAQFVRPEFANPPTDESRTIEAHMGAGSGLVAVLNRSCNDCHSNATVWPWYARIAPVSWLTAYVVSKGRGAVNFSEWARYGQGRQRMLLMESCRDVRQGKMPGLYTVLHPETRLSARDIETVCSATQQVGPPQVE